MWRATEAKTYRAGEPTTHYQVDFGGIDAN